MLILAFVGIIAALGLAAYALFDQLEEPRPALRHATHQAHHRFVLAETHGRTRDKSQRQIELEKSDQVEIPQPGHDLRL